MPCCVCVYAVLCVCVVLCMYMQCCACVCCVVCVPNMHINSHSKYLSGLSVCVCHMHGLTCLLAAAMTSSALRVRIYSGSSQYCSQEAKSW